MNQDEYTKMFNLEDRYWWFVGRRELAIRLATSGLKTGQPRFLDVGCGTGAVLRELSKRGEAVGLDVSPLALAYARTRGIPSLVLGDATALPFGDREFDAVVGLDIFEHIEDHERAYQEAARVLRPGGVLVLSVPAFRSLWSPHDVALHHFRWYRRAEIAACLRQAGLEPVRVSYAVFFLFPLVLVSRLLEKFRRGPARASLPAVPGWLNAALVRLQAFEARLIVEAGLNLPWGSSVVALARKPGGGS